MTIFAVVANFSGQR
jgi:hypothetical protein